MTESPDSVVLAEQAGAWRSAYVHIPFCDRICPYCDFAVVEGKDDLTDRYLDAVLAEISSEPGWHPLDAVFIGGGTPSRVDPGQLDRMVEALEIRFGLAEDVEFSIEANPDDIDGDFARALAATRVNRVSLGAQSFDDQVLERLGRKHSPDQIERAVSELGAAGGFSIGVDLIYGTPGESIDSWSATLHAAIGLGIDHISTYALTVEPATALGKAVRAGALPPDPDDQADKWEMASEVLGGAGFVRYEVSNHARPGHACRYNLAVWGFGQYLAFGLGAHGFRDGVRTRRVRRIETYIDRVGRGLGAVQESEVIEGWDAEVERLMLGLRRTAGVRMGEGGERLLASAGGERLVEAGVIGVEGDRMIVYRPLLTDEVVRTLLVL